MSNYVDGSLIFDTKIDSSGMTEGMKKLKSLATKSAVAVGAGIAAGLGAATKAGIDFESAFAGVRKTVDATETQLASMRSEILDLSTTIPLAATEIAGIAEAAGQLGIKTESITSFTKTMADLGVTTNMTSEQAATSLARLANITQMPQENFDRLGATIVDLGNNLATTESEIVNMALRLAGTGNQVGMTEAQIMSFAGALSSVGIEADAGGTAFSKLMADMQLATSTGNADLQNFAAVADMSAQEFKQAFEEDASQAIIAFIKGLSRAEESGTTAIEILDSMGITEIRMRDALLRAAGASDVFTEAIEIGNKAWEENTALTKEAEQRYDTVESKLTLMKNGLAKLGIAIYDGLQEPFKESITTATEKIGELTESVQSGELNSAVANVGSLFAGLVNTLASLADTVIPVAVNMLSALAENLDILIPAAAALTAGIVAYKVAVNAATVAQGLLNAAMNLSPLGLAISAVTALTVGIGAFAVANKSAAEQTIDELHEMSESYQELKEAQQEQAETTLSQIARGKDLYDQLEELADASGRVAEKDRGRAEFILGELNEALGTEYKMVDGIIQKYDELCLSVENLIQQKQAEILLSSREAAFEQALMNKDEAIAAQAEAYHDLKNVIDEANSAYEGFGFTVQEVLENGLPTDQLNEILNVYGPDFINSVNRFSNVYREASDNVKIYTEDMADYSAAFAAAQEGDFGAAIAVLDKGNNAYKTSMQLMEEQSRLSLGEVGENYAKAVSAVEVAYNNLLNSNNSVNQEALKGALEQAAAMREAYENAGGEVADGYITGMDGKKIALTDKAKEIALAAATAYGEDVSGFEQGGQNSVDGIIAGATSEESKRKLRLAFWGLGVLARIAYDDGQDANSPAKEFIKASKNSIDGLIKGVDDNEDRLMSRMEKLSGDALKAAVASNEALLESEQKYLLESERMEREKEEREYQERLAAAKDAEAVQKIKNERLQEQQEKADKEYLEQLKETAENERDILEERKNALIDMLQEATDEAMEAIDNLADKQNRFGEKLLDSRELFFERTITFQGAGEEGADLTFTETLLGDLEAQNKALEEYADLLLKVRDRGELPSGFFDELREMSIEDGTQFASALLAASDAEFENYLASWQGIQDTSERLAKEVFGEDAAELERQLTEHFGQLPEDFFNIGEESIEQFGEGFMSQLQVLLDDIKLKIQNTLGQLAPAAAVAIGGYAGAGGNTTYNNTYQLATSSETISTQLMAIRAQEAINKLRGL